MDIVGELPESEAFKSILVIRDQFTKVQLYIPGKTAQTAKHVVDSYINNI